MTEPGSLIMQKPRTERTRTDTRAHTRARMLAQWDVVAFLTVLGGQ